MVVPKTIDKKVITFATVFSQILPVNVNSDLLATSNVVRYDVQGYIKHSKENPIPNIQSYRWISLASCFTVSCTQIFPNIRNNYLKSRIYFLTTFINLKKRFICELLRTTFKKKIHLRTLGHGVRCPEKNGEKRSLSNSFFWCRSDIDEHDKLQRYNAHILNLFIEQVRNCIHITKFHKIPRMNITIGIKFNLCVLYC